MQDSDQSVWYQCYHQILAIMNDLGSLKGILPLLILGHFFIGTIVPPLVTSDFERNLFYGQAFWKYGFTVYDMTPLDIDPSYDIVDPISGFLSYSNTTYDYPTVQLLFWACLSSLPFSPIISKWVLSSVDVVNFFFIYFLIWNRKNKGKEHTQLEKGFALSYLIFSIPFSAIEGQPTSISVFFLLLPLILHHRYKMWSYLSIGFGFHWKYISVLVLPYLLIQDHVDVKQALLGFLTVVMSVISLSFPLLFSSFILRYLSSFGNLGSYSGQLPSNPLYLLYPSFSSLLSSVILILALLYWIGLIPMENHPTINLDGVVERAYWLPLILLLSFLKIFATAFPWYWMWIYACLTILPHKDLRLFIPLLGCTFALGLIDFMQMTIGLSTFIGWFF